jgi:hypothetical protein
MTNSGNSSQGDTLRKVPIGWEALQDAFENNAPEVHSYLHLETGEVVRIVEGIAEPSMHERVVNDPTYMQVDPVSSREQYRWMERFIATVEEPDLRHRLLAAIDGKGAFRRFKDALMNHPVDRERWFTFRAERLRSCMEAWLQAHGLEAVERPKWRVPSADEVKGQVEEQERPARRSRMAMADAQRKKLHDLVDGLPARELDAALAFVEFLRERKHMPRLKAKADEVEEEADAPSEAAAEEEARAPEEPSSQ